MSTMPIRGMAAILSERFVTRALEAGRGRIEMQRERRMFVAVRYSKSAWFPAMQQGGGPSEQFNDAILANFLAHNESRLTHAVIPFP